MSLDPTVAIILNTHLPYDRKIVQGIAEYVRTVRRWSLYIESDPIQKLPFLAEWKGEGLIIDFDDHRVADAVANLKIPVVGVGGGRGWYDQKSTIPYLATDDPAIARLAATHLMDQGFKNFAYCGYKATRVNVWSETREQAFAQYLADEGFNCFKLNCRYSNAMQWYKLQQEITEWLRDLPMPLGLMACNDTRARHVLEACKAIGARVPEDIGVLGVDNDELICELAMPPLTSIEQGAFRLGYQAAAMLDKVIRGEQVGCLHHRIAPVGIVARQSTDLLAVEDTEVASAMRLIRQEACLGLTVGKVADHVNISRSSIDKRFKQSLRRTVSQEIQRVQLERAKQLLSCTDLPQSQVASKAGYANVQYLASLLRKHTGLSPAEYRQNTRTARSPQTSVLPNTIDSTSETTTVNTPDQENARNE